MPPSQALATDKTNRMMPSPPPSSLISRPYQAPTIVISHPWIMAKVAKIMTQNSWTKIVIPQIQRKEGQAWKKCHIIR